MCAFRWRQANVADRIGDGAGAFRVDAGNNAWGAWVQVLGSDDTPARAGGAKFDLHRVLITAAERDALYYVQIGFGTSGAAALAAGTYTEFAHRPQSVTATESPLDVASRRLPAGTKAWARCKCPGQNTATLDFIVGLHEYEG